MNKWKDIKYNLPNVYEEVELLMKDDTIYTDMIIQNECGNLEWKHFVNEDIKAWREITR